MQLRVMHRRLALRMVKEEDIWKGKFTCCLILPNLPAGRSAKRVVSAMLFTRTTTHFIFYLTLVPKMTTLNSFVLSTSTTRTTRRTLYSCTLTFGTNTCSNLQSYLLFSVSCSGRSTHARSISWPATTPSIMAPLGSPVR
jgi:hypothetical protein